MIHEYRGWSVKLLILVRRCKGLCRTPHVNEGGWGGKLLLSWFDFSGRLDKVNNTFNLFKVNKKLSLNGVSQSNVSLSLYGINYFHCPKTSYILCRNVYLGNILWRKPTYTYILPSIHLSIYLITCWGGKVTRSFYRSISSLIIMV